MSTPSALAPILAVTLAGLLVLVLDLFRPRAIRAQLGLLMAGLAVAGAASYWAWQSAPTPIGGSPNAPLLVVDRFAIFVWIVLLAAAALTALVSVDYVRRFGLARGEYVVLLGLVTAAAMLLAAATELVLAFLALETLSIGLYVLTAFRRSDLRGQEAGLKYFVLGSFAAALFLYGTALTYAGTGSTNLYRIGAALDSFAGAPTVALAGFALVGAGLAFKLAFVPFHQWTPDVYTGATAPVAGFMSAATKAAAAAVLVRVLWTAYPSLEQWWLPALAAIAAVTLVAGNFMAVVQSDLKRMMGYSAIGHAGAILVAILAGPPEGTFAAAYYLLAYGLTSLGVFAVLALVSARDAAAGGPDSVALDSSHLDHLRGLGRRQPALAVAMTVFLASLAGLPPTAGFLAKWYVFDAAASADLVWLAVLVVLTSVVAAFTYLRPVAYMYFVEPKEEVAEAPPQGAGAVAVAIPALVVAFALVVGAPMAAAARAAAEVGQLPATGGATTGGAATGGAATGGDATASPSQAPPIMFAPPAFEKAPPAQSP